MANNIVNNSNAISMEVDVLDSLLPRYLDLINNINLTLKELESSLGEMSNGIGTEGPHRIMESIINKFNANEAIFNEKLETLNEFFFNQLKAYGAITEEKTQEFVNIADKLS